MSKAWKKREAKAGALFGARRLPVSGRQEDLGGDDCDHPRLHLQVKLRRKHAVVGVWDIAAKYAKKSGKVPVVVLAQHQRPGVWLLVKDTDLAAVAREAVGSGAGNGKESSWNPPPTAEDRRKVGGL